MAKGRAGVTKRTAGFYFGVTIHDANRQVTKDWLASMGIEYPGDDHPEVRAYAPGDMPWKTLTEERVQIFGELRWPHAQEYTRGGARLTVEHITLAQVERLVRLGRIRRVGLTRAEEWA